MTDLTAYEQALVERVARALCAFYGEVSEVDFNGRQTWKAAAPEAEYILDYLGLIGPSRTAWIAPWEASRDVLSDGLVAMVKEIERPHAKFWESTRARDDLSERDAHMRSMIMGAVARNSRELAIAFAAMRDAHLKEGGA